MKINFLKALWGTEREQEAIEAIPKFQKIPHQGTSPLHGLLRQVVNRSGRDSPGGSPGGMTDEKSSGI